VSSGADREELTIRPAVDSDAPGISALIESQLHHRSPTPTGPPPPEFLAGFATDTIRGHIGSPRCRYLVALVEDRVVGVIGMRDERSILHLFVADSWQRRGVGRALWARARSELLASADEVTRSSTPR
jgi:GNAT superfamily N-acetyltransferase